MRLTVKFWLCRRMIGLFERRFIQETFRLRGLVTARRAFGAALLLRRRCRPRWSVIHFSIIGNTRFRGAIAISHIAIGCVAIGPIRSIDSIGST